MIMSASMGNAPLISLRGNRFVQQIGLATLLLIAGIGMSELGFRTLAHAIGFAGVTLGLYLAITFGQHVPFFQRALGAVTLLMAMLALIILNAAVEQGSVHFLQSPTVVPVMSTAGLGIAVMLLGVIIGPYGAARARTLKTQRFLAITFPALLAVSLPLLMSFSWEIIDQPRDHLRAIQWAHVLADLVGIFAGAVLVFRVLRLLSPAAHNNANER